MPHEVLQCLWIHSRFCHIRTIGMSTYMRRDIWQLSHSCRVLLTIKATAFYPLIHPLSYLPSCSPPPFLQSCLMINRCSYKPFFIGFNRNQNSCSDSYCRESQCLYQFVCLWQTDSHLRR